MGLFSKKKKASRFEERVFAHLFNPAEPPPPALVALWDAEERRDGKAFAKALAELKRQGVVPKGDGISLTLR